LSNTFVKLDDEFRQIDLGIVPRVVYPAWEERSLLDY